MKKGHGLMALAVVVASAGCSSAAPAKDQVVSGRAALTSFPTAVNEVHAMRGSQLVTRSAVTTDGRFSIAIPAGSGYELVFAAANSVPLVFPRSSGAIDRRFDIRAGGKAFDLGAVRYVGDPAAQAFAFNHVGSTAQALTKPGAVDDDDLECENGIDAKTGAVCVDDDDEEGAGACEGSEEDGEEDDDDGVDCVDGIDAATGLECDGGPAANSDADEGEEDGEEASTEAAVADHNLPAAIGCAEEDGDDHECEDGIDPATGLECDGGPAANGDDGEDED